MSRQVDQLALVYGLLARFLGGQVDRNELVAYFGDTLRIIALAVLEHVLHIAPQQHPLLDVHIVQRLLDLAQVCFRDLLPAILIQAFSVEQHEVQDCLHEV